MLFLKELSDIGINFRKLGKLLPNYGNGRLLGKWLGSFVVYAEP